MSNFTGFFRILVISLTLFAIVFVCPLNAQVKKRSKGVFGIVYGSLGSGDIKFDGRKVTEKDAAGSGGIFLDIPAGRRFQMGVYGEIHQLKGRYIESKPVLNIGLTSKVSLRSHNAQFYFRPGVGVGFAAAPDIYTTGKSFYLTCRGFLDFVLQSRGTVGCFAQIGLLMAPLGGNRDNDITVGPMLLLRGGITFGEKGIHQVPN
jgi:hypothetical protein